MWILISSIRIAPRLEWVLLLLILIQRIQRIQRRMIPFLRLPTLTFRMKMRVVCLYVVYIYIYIHIEVPKASEYTIGTWCLWLSVSIYVCLVLSLEVGSPATDITKQHRIGRRKKAHRWVTFDALLLISYLIWHNTTQHTTQHNTHHQSKWHRTFQAMAQWCIVYLSPLTLSLSLRKSLESASSHGRHPQIMIRHSSSVGVVVYCYIWFWHFDILTFWHFDILTFWHFDILTFWHFDILTEEYIML